MNITQAVQEELDHIAHILTAVPFTPGSETHTFFLGIFKIRYKDIADLELTESSWESHNQVAVNKLLKFSISLGNLVRTFQLDKEAYDAKTAQQDSYIRSHGPKQSSNPFNDNFVPADKSTLSVPVPYVTFIRNLALIMKNFDIGTAINRSSSTFGNYGSKKATESGSLNGSSSTVAGVSSPIRLNSKQLLIEKLEINIRLDPLFTSKIVFKLFMEIFAIVSESLQDLPQDFNESEVSLPIAGNMASFSAPKPPSETSSIFSSLSNGQDSISTTDDYVRCIKEVLNRVNTGIVYPFTSFVQHELVNPQIINGFQGLVDTI